MSELAIVEQRDVTFYGDALSAVRGGDGRIYVNFNQVCDALGIDGRSQRRRLAEHDILAEAVTMATLPTPGGPQQTTVIRADMVPLWLSTVRAAAVRQELQEKLRRFQREAAAVLWEAFQSGRLTADPSDIFSGVSPETAQAVQVARAVLALAENQAAMERRHSEKIETVEARLETIEAAMSLGDRYVTQNQASQISEAVKAVALAQGKNTGRNEFAGVYSEMYRKFGITSYKLLPARRFEEVMLWLTEWYGNLTGEDDLPF